MVSLFGQSQTPSSFGRSLLFALISISLFNSQPSTNPSLDLRSVRFESENGEVEIQRRNYIVRFFEYKKAEEHRRYLEETIGSNGWKWIERRNPAASFPTDFGVVSMEDSYRKVLIEEFGKLGVVKDVSVDSSYSRSLFAGNLEKGGGFIDEKKRPGKIFTSMSYEGGGFDSGVSNYTISWKRKLMFQQNEWQRGVMKSGVHGDDGNGDVRCGDPVDGVVKFGGSGGSGGDGGWQQW